MSNFSYQVLQEKYKEAIKENKKLKEIVGSENKFHYYYYANKRQLEINKELRAENKDLKKQNIELSILVDYLRRNNG
jgi:hypothetical protein